MDTRTIRPGLLVGLKTSIVGGPAYFRKDLENEQVGDESRKKWETVRVVQHVDELAAAQLTRNRARGEVVRVCMYTSFGLLCTVDREPELLAAIERAQRMVRDHNDVNRNVKVQLYVLRGRVADNDEMAARAIAAELRGLIEEMGAAVDRADPEAIRRAATEARKMLGVLSEEKQELATKAIEAARKAARQIATRVEKKGEAIAQVIKEIDGSAIAAARMAFLDLDEPAAPAATTDAAPVVRDIDTNEPEPQAAPLPSVELRRFDGELW